jgi:hypothetical protein
MSDLTTAEQSIYENLCIVVERGMAHFVEVGMALAELNAKRLYRAEYPTFEAFVAAKFSLSRRRAYQMIEEAKVAAEVPALRNGAQARALAAVEPEQREEVLALAGEGGKVTAASIAEAARKVNGNGTQPIEGWRIVAISDRIAKCVDELEALEGTPVAHWMPFDRVRMMAERLCKTISDAVPDSPCEACDSKGCPECSGHGFVPGRLTA